MTLFREEFLVEEAWDALGRGFSRGFGVLFVLWGWLTDVFGRGRFLGMNRFEAGRFCGTLVVFGRPLMAWLGGGIERVVVVAADMEKVG